MKQVPPEVRAPGSEVNGYTQKVDNTGQRDSDVLSDPENRELNNNCVLFGNCDPLSPQSLSGHGSLSAHGDSVTGMSDQPSSRPDKGHAGEGAQTGSSDFGGDSKKMSQTNAGSTTSGDPSPAVASELLINTDIRQSPPGYGERRTQPVSSGSHSADAITVLSPSIDKSLHDRNLAQKEQQPKPTMSRRARGIPGVFSSGDLSKLLTLDEDKELDISSSVRSELVVQPPSPNRLSPGMMGRRHSMDSNIGRSRPPTFVRTYRDVKWKRVSKPSKLRQLPRTPSAENLLTAPGSGAEGEEESREYITGTHIIRQRVPIFMTSRDPPDHSGRRFSAGDLIPVSGQGRNFTLNGKCLVIRDMLLSNDDHTSSSEDSSSSNSSPSSSTEDVRVSQSTDGSGDSSEERGDEHYEFSLIDEDEEDDDLTGGSDNDEDENKKNDTDTSMDSDLGAGTTNSSTDGDPASRQKTKTPNHLDLRRLALENALLKKATVRLPAAASNRGNAPQSTSASSPQVPFPSSSPEASPTSGVSETNRPGMVPSVTEHPVVPIKSHPNEDTCVSNVPLAIVAPSTSQPALLLTAAQSVTRTQPLPVPNTDRQTSISTTSLSSMGTTSAHDGLSLDASLLVPTTSHTPVELGTDQSHHTTITNATQAGHPSLTHLPVPGYYEPSDPHLCPPHEGILSRPSSPCEMPWVMTSTKIADANVFVSSSHTPNSSMSTRSAHWISPRSVEGTIPINLEDARAIRVETVAVPTNDESEPLQFQKVTYSSGFIISSAQWVAPTAESPSPSEVKSLPLAESTEKQTDIPQPASTPPQGTPGSGQSTPTKKLRRKYIVGRTGPIQRPVLFNSDLLPVIHQESPASRTAHSSEEVVGKDDHLNVKITDSSSPSLLDSSNSGTSPRQPKRRFDVARVVDDHLDTSEVDLTAQNMLSSLSLSSSPTKSKRKFVVEKVPEDVVGAPLSSLNGLSAKLDMTFCPTQSTLGCVVNEVSEKPLENTGGEAESDVRPSLPSQHSDSAGLDSTLHESIPLVTHKQLEASQSAATQDIPQDSHEPDLFQEHHTTSPTDSDCVFVSTTCSELATQLRESSATIDSVDKRLSSGRHTRLRTDTEDDEKFAKENDALLQMILTSISDTEEADTLDDNHGGGSTVAIDNKIEQAMDLVKRHLMYAVREEVEILKQQIGEMMDRIGQLEYENTVLRSEAKPETLSKLLQPRLAQPPQAALPTQPQTASITAAPTQQQPAASQVQPPQQQQTSVSQVGQPPSTT